MYFSLFRVVIFVVTAIVMPPVALGRLTSSNDEGNDINDIFRLLPEESKLPVCAGNTICAYLQANNWGINTQPLCSCSGPNRCPLVWDSDDGQSVTQGSDQYKYCRKAPVLRTCKQGMTAYTSFSLSSKSKKRMIALNEVNHCICPGQTANHDMVDAPKFEIIDDDTSSLSYTYVCNPLKTCEVSEPCKRITETATTYLVNPRCKCARDEPCPSSSVDHGNNNGRKINTYPYGKGIVHEIFCH